MGQFNPFAGSISGGGSGSSGSGGSGTSGRGISSIVFVSSTGGLNAGIAGATDTYRINYTDGTSTTYVVKNGENGENGEDGRDGVDGIPGVGIQSITFTSSSKGEQPSINGAIDTYTIAYTDNTTSTFNIYNGEDGEKVLLRATDNAIQYKYETDLSWTNLISIDELKGPQGPSGSNGNDGISIINANVNSNGELIITLSNNEKLNAGVVKGADGTSVNIIDDLASTSDLPSTGQHKGDSYLINGELWVYTGSADAADAINGFKNVGTIKGPTGRGVQSLIINLQGELIVTYTDGSENNLGKITGENGIDGDSAYEIAVNNGFSGTEAEWLESLKGEKGDTGDDGKGILSIEFKNSSIGAGANAAQEGATDTYTITYTDNSTTEYQIKNGEKGSNGLSAYEIWQELGNTGTKQEFIDSLKGEQGDTGISVRSIVFTSSSKGSSPGIAGAIDTYTVTLTDDNTSTFTVYNGTNGKNGTAATVSVGTVTTGAANSSATVINSGTVNAAIFDFVIPKGVSGNDGKGILNIKFKSSSAGGTIPAQEGAVDTYVITYTDNSTSEYQIKNGTKGQDGDDGLSAYQTWKDLGNTGTEQDFIESLKGAKGNTGVGIQSITFTSSSGGNTPGIASATDTYTITYTNSTTSEFNVYNGANGEKILLQKADGYIQYKYEEDLLWNNLVNLEDLKGSDGIDGDSAYEIAVNNGFSGTEAEWLESLKGEKGDIGIGIRSVVFTSSSGGSTPGIAGATDTYTITLTDGNTSTFIVHNGANGSNATVTVDSSLSSSSVNPVQNKIVTNALAGKANAVHTHTGSQIYLSDATIEELSSSGNTVEDGLLTIHSKIGDIQTALDTIINGTVHIYGVSWDGTESTSWTRTDDSSDFADPVPYVAGATNYGSPFDNIYPWAGMTVSERAGGTMVAIPKFWYKLSQSENGMSIQIADKAIEGFHVSPAHMDRGDGKGERDVVYVGRYHCGATTGKSKSGELPKVEETRSEARTRIHGYGSNIWQRDKAMSFTLQLLYLVEFADWNSQTRIGKGCGDGSSSGTQYMGYTDSMPYHTGTMKSSRDEYGCSTQYRNIEGLWDNCYSWEDGGYNNSNGYNFILNPANYSDSSGGVVIGIPSSGYPSKFAVKDVSGAFPMFIPTEKNGSGTTFSCDSWGFSASSPCVYVGGSHGQGVNFGLFFVDHISASSAGGNLGSRLMELPDPSGKLPCNLTLSTNHISLSPNDGDVRRDVTISKEGNGTVTVESSNTELVTVTLNDNIITILSSTTDVYTIVTVTVTVAECDGYLGDTATIEVDVDNHGSNT